MLLLFCQDSLHGLGCKYSQNISLLRLQRNLQIIHSSSPSTNDRDTDKTPVLCAVVQGGRPVVGKVSIDGTRRAGGFLCSGIIHRRSESTPTKDDMRVPRDLARIDDRIKALGDEGCGTRHSPVGIGGDKDSR